MTNCYLCQKQHSDPKHNPHKICVLCGKEIHATQSYHADGEGARHMACEIKSDKK